MMSCEVALRRFEASRVEAELESGIYNTKRMT